MKGIAADLDAEWISNRKSSPASASRSTARIEKGRPNALKADLNNLPDTELDFVEPMKCRLVAELPEGSDWIYEIKFDGIRALTLKEGATVCIRTRAGNDVTKKFAEVVRAVEQLPCERALFDGEIVALEKSGRSSFQLLQTAHAAGQRRPPIRFYIFDLLNLEGKNLAGLPLFQRKEILQRLVSSHENTVRVSANIEGDAKQLLTLARERGLEGIIAKQRQSKYEPGRRTGTWVKFKCINTQEFVLGGYTAPGGTRQYFGSVLVGYYAGGKLLFASKVGTGFDARLLESLFRQFQKLKRADCPFANLPEQRSGQFGQGLTASAMKRCTWIQPKLVCQVAFGEWTRDNHLRQPVFLGLREDKLPKEIVREAIR
jgi:bifunctional non-homologous end joining protein LigD